MDLLNFTLQNFLQADSFISSGLGQSILGASITGAGLILATYTLFLRFSEKYFNYQATIYNESVEELEGKYTTPIHELSLGEINELKEKVKESQNIKKLPKWLSKWSIISFKCYIVSTLIAFMSFFISSLIYDLILIGSFLASTYLFLYVGSNLLNAIVKILRDDYEKMTLKVSASEKFVATTASTVMQLEGLVPKISDDMIEVVSYDFEDDAVGIIPKNWTLGSYMLGTIEVTDVIGAEDTLKSLKIYNPENSRDVIRTSFEPLDKFTLIFSLRQEIYGDKRGVGTGFHINQGTTEAIWFMITHKKLMGYWDNEYHEFCNIEEKRWYKIRLDVDCNKQEYYCYVDGTLIRRGLFRNKVNKVDTLHSAMWQQQAERLGYLDEIKILKPETTRLR